MDVAASRSEGRDPNGLKQIAARTGLHIVMASGGTVDGTLGKDQLAAVRSFISP